MTDIIPSKILHPAEIVQFPLNSNSHPPAQVEELVASRQRFSQYRNVVTWTCPDDIETVDASGQPVTLKKGIAYVLAGNGFHLASLKRQDEAIEVKDYSHLTLDEAILLAETDNAAPLGAQRMVEQLKANLERARSLYVNDERMNRMFERLRGQVGLNGHTSKDTEPQIDKTAILREQWGVELGQIWQLGQHRLVCGDCTDRAVVEAVMRGEKAALCVTDPPYGIQLETDPGEVNTDYKGWQGKKGRYASIIGDDKDYDPTPIFENFGYCAEMFLWGADYYAEKIPDKNKGSWLVWDKRSNQESGSILSPETLGSEFEICWSKQKHKRYIIRKIWGGLFGTETQDIRTRVHPTQKPVEVIAWIMEKYTKTGDLIADPYLGSGTTLIAAENLSRRCRAIEIDPGYVAVTLQRFLDSTGIEPKRID